MLDKKINIHATKTKKTVTTYLQFLVFHMRAERHEKFNLSWECRVRYANKAAQEADNLKGIALVLRTLTYIMFMCIHFSLSFFRILAFLHLKKLVLHAASVLIDHQVNF